MSRAWIAITAAAVVGLALIAGPRQAHAAALNETNLPEEIDFCRLDSPASANAGPGDLVPVAAPIGDGDFASTAGSTPVAELNVEAGIGPVGTDPRVDPGWSYSSIGVTDASGVADVYQGTLTAPLPVNNTQYAVTVRVSDAAGLDHTYCDLDIAGSSPGVDFDPAELGVVTVTGTAGADNGSVTTTIEAQEAPGPCILLDTSNIDYGVQAFSTSLTPRSATGQVTVTNCGVEAEDIFARGADATGASATWTLTTPPGPSRNTCDLGSGGVNEYGHAVNASGNPAILDLTTTNQTYQSGLGATAGVATDTTLSMPCSGSDGAGELMSTSITFTAVAVSPAP